MNIDLEDKIMSYLNDHLEVKSVTATEIAGILKRSYKVCKEALINLHQQKKLWSQDISSKTTIGEGIPTKRMYQDPLYVYYLPNGLYLRGKTTTK